MPVQEQTPYIKHLADGLTNTFAFPFKIFEAEQLEVRLNGAVQATGFTLSGVGDETGGSVVFTANPVTGTVVEFERKVAYSRAISYAVTPDFRGKTVDNDFDRLQMQMQQVKAYVDVSVKSGLGDDVINGQGKRLTNLADPVDPQDAATKKSVLEVAASFVLGNLSDASVTTAKLAFDGGALGFRNKIINGNFSVNQAGYVSGSAVPSDKYGHDMWKMGAAGDSYTFSTVNGLTTATIPSGKVLQQIVEGVNLETGTYVLSWTGTAQGKIAGGSYGVSGAVTASITGGTNTTIEFNTGTVTDVRLELGTTATPFEHRPYGLELALCQRYYWDSGSAVSGGYPRLNGYGAAGTAISANIKWPVQMRSAPTVTVLISAGWALTNCSAPVVSASTPDGVFMSATIISTGGADAYAGVGNKAIIVSARL